MCLIVCLSVWIGISGFLDDNGILVILELMGILMIAVWWVILVELVVTWDNY